LKVFRFDTGSFFGDRPLRAINNNVFILYGRTFGPKMSSSLRERELELLLKIHGQPYRPHLILLFQYK